MHPYHGIFLLPLLQTLITLNTLEFSALRPSLPQAGTEGLLNKALIGGSAIKSKKNEHK